MAPPSVRRQAARRLIVTGDDFGLSETVNEAVAEAHRHGILTAASLMVGAPAADDAVARARALPTLAVGLHVVVVNGWPVLPPASLPGLADADGRLPGRLVRAGFGFQFHAGARESLEREIRAQFEAFARTGLPLDHVNAHCHMHLHPRVLAAILRVGQEFGLAAVRVPREPPLRSWRAARRAPVRRLTASLGLAPWLGRLRRRLAEAGVRSNDWVFGRTDTGRMAEDLLLGFVRELPPGVTEIYCHPATRPVPELGRSRPGEGPEAEFRALTSPRVTEALGRTGAERIAFTDI